MNKDIEKLKDELKKTLENYEIDKKCGQLSVDSIYSMFPTESKLLLDYLEQLQKQNVELIKTKNKVLSYIQNYNHMNLRYQYAETKDKLNIVKNILNGREDYHDKLQTNWNELKKWLEDKDNNGFEKFYVEDMLILMQELEGKSESTK